MRHLFKKWASNNQLMTTTPNNNNKNSLSSTIYHQRVPIIEEEEFDDDDEGSFCSITFSLYMYVCMSGVFMCTLTSVNENQ